ncbi:unnamed protein product [Paramecium octaurelia]|uniref:Uncharacterized protein n=1 Tax=Paramecium octaurelia TaxID=43137 RepID=A0A8S1W090_PAROT|nr:unnamed protein product [Paramecium octaurelia]
MWVNPRKLRACSNQPLKNAQDQQVKRKISDQQVLQLHYDPDQFKGIPKKKEKDEFKEEQNLNQILNQINIENFKCACPNHDKSILMVVLDPNLKSHERLKCSQCIVELEPNSRNMGLNKAIGITQDNYKKKKEQIEIVVECCYKDIEQIKNNLIQLKSHLINKLDQMLEITNMWMKDLQNYKEIEYNFANEIQRIVDSEDKHEIDQLLIEIKPLNMKWIPKLQSNLYQFSSFKEYSICQTLLKKLAQEKTTSIKKKEAQKSYSPFPKNQIFQKEPDFYIRQRLPSMKE